MLSFSAAIAETSEERPGAAIFCEAPMWIGSLREMIDRGCACKDLISKRTWVYFEAAIVGGVIFFACLRWLLKGNQSYASYFDVCRHAAKPFRSPLTSSRLYLLSIKIPTNL